jgi:hypothetical protein
MSGTHSQACNEADAEKVGWIYRATTIASVPAFLGLGLLGGAAIGALVQDLRGCPGCWGGEAAWATVFAMFTGAAIGTVVGLGAGAAVVGMRNRRIYRSPVGRPYHLIRGVLALGLPVAWGSFSFLPVSPTRLHTWGANLLR